MFPTWAAVYYEFFVQINIQEFAAGSVVESCYAAGPQAYAGAGKIDVLAYVTSVYQGDAVCKRTVTPFVATWYQSQVEHGITPFNADFAMPWTATTILEGFGCPEFYSSLDGRNWISSFISGKATSVNANGTAATAAVIRRLKDNGIITPDLLNSNVTDVENALANGTLAMTRKSSDAQYDTNKLHKYTALPFFGKTASDSCLFTYPVFCLGMPAQGWH